MKRPAALEGIAARVVDALEKHWTRFVSERMDAILGELGAEPASKTKKTRAPRVARSAPPKAKRAQGRRTCTGCGSTDHDRRICPKLGRGEDDDEPETESEDVEDEDDRPAAERPWKPPRKPRGTSPAWGMMKQPKGPRHPHAAQARKAAAAAEAKLIQRYDGKRSLVRCLEAGCGVAVLNVEREIVGHCKRAHGGRAVQFQTVPLTAGTVKGDAP